MTGTEGFGPSVREATDADAEAFGAFLRAVWEEAGPEAPGFAGATDEVIAEISTPEAVRQRIGGPERRLFLSVDEPRVVGFAATRRVDEATVELAGIIVSKSHAGQGLGTRLVDAAVDRAGQEGYRVMTVRTETSNEAARGFYESCGFAVRRVTSEHVGDVAVEVWELTRDL